MAKTTAPRDVDTILARDMQLFAENDEKCYKHYEAFAKNFVTKMAQGKYDHALAVKGMKYLVETIKIQYAKINWGPEKLRLNKATNEYLQKLLAAQLYKEIIAGDWKHYVPKKYQK